jgi:hypothetical protein
MGFADAVDSAMTAWFGSEFADTVALNGTDVNVQVLEHGTEEAADGKADYVDVEFLASDYPTITYRTDTVVWGGLTFRYPKKSRDDGRTRVVRFRRNVRPRA